VAPHHRGQMGALVWDGPMPVAQTPSRNRWSQPSCTRKINHLSQCLGVRTIEASYGKRLVREIRTFASRYSSALLMPRAPVVQGLYCKWTKTALPDTLVTGHSLH
jgi:hypothetical protein